MLTEIGELDLAYKLQLNEDFPSWGYPIRNGATTMWERWDGYRHDKGLHEHSMNSFNHYAYGAVGDWMYRNIGGIDLDPRQVGYRNIVVRPRLGGGLAWAKASLESPNGRISVDWRTEKKAFLLSVTVPPNSTATVFVPTKKASGVTESGKPAARSPGVKSLGRRDGYVLFQVESGEYRFTSRISPR